MTDDTHTDNYTHAITTRTGTILCISKMESGILDEYGDSKDLTDIH